MHQRGRVALCDESFCQARELLPPPTETQLDACSSWGGVCGAGRTSAVRGHMSP